ncbi:hypothetical protein BDZ94DRAFT_1268428 [Collybia nuda]|uniref:DEK C-terminal domain-containing protein n=1 Tax=Collybia nuda TaxID=64659 RepID=A0A9P5XZ20_9AGAR|nr:hypothetical protein BDZ94DRAFT_1268428 [Collybia nuda]
MPIALAPTSMITDSPLCFANMDIPFSDLESAARDIIRREMLNGDPEFLTKGNVRKKIEQRFNLDPGTLSAKEHKYPLNAAIQTAVNEFDEDMDDGGDNMAEQRGTRVKIQKGAKTPRKPTPTVSHPKLQPTKKKRGENSREYKSAAYIAVSDMEDEVEPETIESSTSKRLPSRRTSDKTLIDNVKSELPPQKRQKFDHFSEGSPQTNTHVARVVEDGNSESEMSILFDEAPKKTKVKKQEEDGKKQKLLTEKKGRKTPQELSKDEATIKRLKSLVTACGMRRPWKKLLEGCDTPSQQTKKLKEILTELGMSGRLSLDQAKKIKAKRELAKELEEVQSFAQPISERPSRSKFKSKPEEEIEPNDEESDEGTMPTKRNRRNALMSITAFLGDQSDDN